MTTIKTIEEDILHTKIHDERIFNSLTKEQKEWYYEELKQIIELMFPKFKELLREVVVEEKIPTKLSPHTEKNFPKAHGWNLARQEQLKRIEEIINN